MIMMDRRTQVGMRGNSLVGRAPSEKNNAHLPPHVGSQVITQTQKEIGLGVQRIKSAALMKFRWLLRERIGWLYFGSASAKQ